VNRCWEQLFGLGIVETLEDFGSPGIPPSHPELLDFLALRFQNELGWSVKRLLREIVTSAAYRQSPTVSAAKLEKDPRNKLLSRGPRLRLTAEMTRDNALRVSGLLSPKAFGPPVMPFQPDGVWRVVHNASKWENASGDDRYRRAIYTYWKRSTPYPSFVTFDSPSRDVCTSRRIPTNVPLQALVTLNDPVYLECARNLARLTRESTTGTPDAWVRRALHGALLEAPDDAQVASFAALYADTLQHLQENPALVTELGDSPEAAAMTVVASAIMNLDEFLTK
jgi:hypothetical protein